MSHGEKISGSRSMNPIVIGISGNMGSGKTTLAHALQQHLKSTLLCWDDFDDLSISPSDYVAWYHQGQDYKEWDYQALADILKALKTKQPVVHPLFKQSLIPTEYIVFDAPLGRLHQQTGQYIDFQIHINIPLDISLCRHLLRDYKDDHKTKEELIAEIDYYLNHSRPLFFDDHLSKDADLIIDGMLSTKEQIHKVYEYLKREYE